LKPNDIEDFSNNLLPFNTTVSAGDLYTMTDIRQFHQVSTPEVNYSLMLMGTPYFSGATKQFSRKSPNVNIELQEEEINDLMDTTKEYFKK